MIPTSIITALEATSTLLGCFSVTWTSPLHGDAYQWGSFLSCMPLYTQILSPISKDKKYAHSCTNGRMSSEGPAHMAVKPQCLPDQLTVIQTITEPEAVRPDWLSFLLFFRETDLCWWHLSTCWLPKGGTRMNILKVDSLPFSLLRLDFPASASLLPHGN